MILFLGNKNNSVYHYLRSKYLVKATENKISPEYISKFDRVISYGYRHILTKSHIDKANHPIINLHISYLPWNKGADPNYWSWVENTPKGVTIHYIDEGIDTGDILIQAKVKMGLEETLASSYAKLKNIIENLFIENYEKIVLGDIKPFKQPPGGSIHYKKNSPNISSWDIKTKNLIK